MAAAATALLLPLRAVAAIWNKSAFDATKLHEAEKSMAINGEIPSKDIDIIAPDRAENGAIVQLEVTSHIPNTEAIAVFVEKNPTALIGNFMFSNGAHGGQYSFKSHLSAFASFKNLIRETSGISNADM